MMEGLDESFDAVIFIGYHAKAGNPGGLFAHTGSGVVRDVRVNGESLGEGGLNTMVAAWYGVPVALVTGDDVAVKQVAEVATSAKTVAVKRAINPRAVELRPFAAVHGEIEEAAYLGVRDAKKFQQRRDAQLQGRSAVPGNDDPGGCRQPADHGASVTRHDRVHHRLDAEGLHADPPAVSLHQSGVADGDGPRHESRYSERQWRASKTTDSSAIPRRRRWYRPKGLDRLAVFSALRLRSVLRRAARPA